MIVHILLLKCKVYVLTGVFRIQVSSAGSTVDLNDFMVTEFKCYALFIRQTS